MAALTVDRMHTRYVGDAVRFEGLLRRMVDEELDRALESVPLPAGHVCVRRLTVPVRLDRRGAAAAGSWATQIAAALARAVAGADGRAEDVIVYRRTLDGVVEMLIAAGRGDLRRQWAWQQAGVLPAGPLRPAAVAAALARRPELACAALAAAAPHGPLPLTAAGWVAVAGAVAELAGETAAAGPVPTGSMLDTPVGRRLPVAEIAAQSRPGEQRAVARLLLLCAQPALSRSEPAIAATIARLARPRRPAGSSVARSATPPEAPASASESAPELPPGPARGIPAAEAAARPLEPAASPAPAEPSAAPPDARPPAPARPSATPVDDHPPAREPLPAGPPAGEPAAVSPVGGVFFLIAATGVLEPLPEPLADHPLSTVVAWLAAGFGEVGTDDPAVHLLAGRPPEPLRPPGPDEEPALADLAGRLVAWLRPLLRLEPDDDLGWLWRRPAQIAAEPGWAEITYALEDVDTRIRAAGLDLDPGFVWWLGAVVRYRYA